MEQKKNIVERVMQASTMSAFLVQTKQTKSNAIIHVIRANIALWTAGGRVLNIIVVVDSVGAGDCVCNASSKAIAVRHDQNVGFDCATLQLTDRGCCGPNKGPTRLIYFRQLMTASQQRLI